jgi:WD40 repeat protein
MKKGWIVIVFLFILTACSPIANSIPSGRTYVTKVVTPTSGPLAPLNEITLENAAKVRLLRSLDMPGYVRGSISQCNTAFSPDGKLLLGVCGQGPVGVWEVQSGNLSYILDTQKKQLVTCTFSPDGKFILCGGFDRAITLWNAANGEFLETIASLDSPVWDLVFSPDGAQFASCGINDAVRLWNFSDRKQIWKSEDASSCLSIDFAPDGKEIAFGTRWGKAGILETASGKTLVELISSHNPVGDIAFSHNGKWLAAGTDDDLIYVWPADQWLDKQTWTGHYNFVNGVSFNKDDTLLISSSHDNSSHFWNVQTGQIVKTVRGHSDVILRNSLSPNGTIVATISWDGTVALGGVPLE